MKSGAGSDRPTYATDRLGALSGALTLGSTGAAVGLFARHAATETQLRRDGQVTELQWHWKYPSRVLPGVAVISILLLAVQEVAALAIWAVEPVVAFLSSLRRRR